LSFFSISSSRYFSCSVTLPPGVYECIEVFSEGGCSGRGEFTDLKEGNSRVWWVGVWSMSRIPIPAIDDVYEIRLSSTAGGGELNISGNEEEETAAPFRSGVIRRFIALINIMYSMIYFIEKIKM
jgi:hypothetical protein